MSDPNDPSWTEHLANVQIKIDVLISDFDRRTDRPVISWDDIRRDNGRLKAQLADAIAEIKRLSTPVAPASPCGKPFRLERRFSNGCEVCPEVWRGREWVATISGAPHLGHPSVDLGRRIVAALNASTKFFGVDSSRPESPPPD